MSKNIEKIMKKQIIKTLLLAFGVIFLLHGTWVCAEDLKKSEDSKITGFKNQALESEDIENKELKDIEESQKTQNIEGFLSVANEKPAKKVKKAKKKVSKNPGSYIEIEEGVFKKAGGSDKDLITPYSGEWYLHEPVEPVKDKNVKSKDKNK